MNMCLAQYRLKVSTYAIAYIYIEREHSMSCIIRGSVFKNGQHSWDIYIVSGSEL